MPDRSSDRLARGMVHLVGAGPGDPGLLTIKGRDALRLADVVVYDRLVNPALLDEVPAEALRIFVGKLPGGDGPGQEDITALLVAQARRGRRVVRLKGGDPFVFGRGGEEAEALAAAGISFEIVPGVSSAIAVPAYAGIPLTHRGIASSFAVVTGHDDPAKDRSPVDWARLAGGADTLVVLMGADELARIARALLDHGRAPSTPVALIRWGTTDAQATRVGTLTEAAAQDLRLDPPMVAVIGEVVALRERLAWFTEDGGAAVAPRPLSSPLRANADQRVVGSALDIGVGI